MRCACSASCARTHGCRSSNWPIQRKPRSPTRSQRSVTRIWPARAKAGTTLAPTIYPQPIDPRESSHCRGGFMNSIASGGERHARTIRAWQLAILRFAETLDNADRLAVLAIAAEMDGFDPQQGGRPTFGFFRKASAELCAAILQPNELASTLLRQYLARYLARIDDERLRRAFMAAVGADQSKVSSVSKPIRPDNGLWRGPSPGDQAH